MKNRNVKYLLATACVVGVLLGCRWHWFYLPLGFGPIPILPVPLPISPEALEGAAAQFAVLLLRLF